MGGERGNLGSNTYKRTKEPPRYTLTQLDSVLGSYPRTIRVLTDSGLPRRDSAKKAFKRMPLCLHQWLVCGSLVSEVMSHSGLENEKTLGKGLCLWQSAGKNCLFMNQAQCRSLTQY